MNKSRRNPGRISSRTRLCHRKCKMVIFITITIAPVKVQGVYW